MRTWLLSLILAVLVVSPPVLALEGEAEVVDGDTLRVGAATVRLQGIDAPESSQTCTDRSGGEWACGKSATRALAQLAARGTVRCDPMGKDVYGRILAVCRTGEVDINRQLVLDGWAYAFVKYDSRYRPEEDAARRAGRGIWRGGSEAPWEWRAGRLARATETHADGCVIKGNLSASGERVYHLPWQQAYKRTRVNTARGERWFCSEDEAQGAGWRRALR